MNREALDEFFAKAEDVLTDWRPSDDAMVARVPDEGAEDLLAPIGESYYDQPWHSDSLRSRWFRARVGTEITWAPIFDETRWFQAAQRMGEIFTAEAERIREQLQRTMPPIPREWLNGTVIATSDPAARALELRRNRNTGPADRRGLDGRFRRNASR